MPKNDKEIGALWTRESKNGNSYMSGNIEVGGETVRIVVFKNSYKKKDTHPDYLIYKSEPIKQTAETEDSSDLPF